MWFGGGEEGAEDIYIYKTAKDKTCTVHRLSVSNQRRTHIFSSSFDPFSRSDTRVDECVRLRFFLSSGYIEISES